MRRALTVIDHPGTLAFEAWAPLDTIALEAVHDLYPVLHEGAPPGVVALLVASMSVAADPVGATAVNPCAGSPARRGHCRS